MPRAKSRLTEARLKKLKPGQWASDSEVPGLIARRHKHATSFSFRATMDGRQRIIPLGEWSVQNAIAFHHWALKQPADGIKAQPRYSHDETIERATRGEDIESLTDFVVEGGSPLISLEQARAQAEELRRRLRRGENLKPKTQLPVRLDTYGEVAAEFVDKYARRRQRSWRETARVLGLREVEGKLEPIKGGLADPEKWGSRAMADIKARDAYELLDGFVTDGNEAKARVTQSWLRTMWQWAYKRELVPAPMMDQVDLDLMLKRRERFYSDDELRAIWNGADKLQPYEAAFVQLVTLLGVRAGELAGMRRSELDDLDKPTLWTVPTVRTKTRKRHESKGRVYLVPLPPLAQKILAGLEPDDREGGDPDLVFPGRNRGRPLGPGTEFKQKVRQVSGVADWYCHAHRDTVATWLENEGHSEYERGLVLNHAGAGTVTAGYSHGYPLELKRTLLEKWAKHVGTVVTVLALPAPVAAA